MLKGIDPFLGPELLGALRAMGHGDEILVADANFPAAALAARLVRTDGVGAVRMVQAIVSVMPLDDFVPAAAFRMADVDHPENFPYIAGEFEVKLKEAGYRGALEPLERSVFYARAKTAYAIVATGETQLYGNLILKKGVIRPEQKPT